MSLKPWRSVTYVVNVDRLTVFWNMVVNIMVFR